MEFIVAGIPAFLYSVFIGSMARRRKRATVRWIAVTFLAAFAFFVCSTALPSQSPGTARVVICLIAISGFVWCALAPIFVCVRVRQRSGA